MRRYQGLLFSMTLAAAVLLAGCWGEDKSTSLDVAPVAPPGRVGSATCINCHGSFNTTVGMGRDLTGTDIQRAWQETTHTTDGRVQCEDCHGGGQYHWGVGPIPFPNPGAAACNRCHELTGFDNTQHANPDNRPDLFFFQGGAGTEQARTFDQPEFTPENTAVTRGQHIEECSRCHNPNERFVYADNALVGHPLRSSNDPQGDFGQGGDDNIVLSHPAVNCGGCHDGHYPQAKVTIPQRTGRVGVEIYRRFFTDNTGAIVDNDVANFDNTTTPLLDNVFRGNLFQPNGAVTAAGTVDNTRVVGTNNEIHPERICTPCHTKGLYKYSRTPTHNDNISAQYANSGHGDMSAPAFGEFSANPSAYGFDSNDHQVRYPYDMSKTGVGATATATRNAGNSNYACYKCHHGVGSTAYSDNVEGTAAAPVLFGDAPVTCITCHDPHQNRTASANIRKPLVMSKYTNAAVTFSGNVFFDNTPVPDNAGNGAICIFCHQGRESGLTLFKRRLAADNTLSGNFLNPHYLATAAILWGRNGFEYTDNTGAPRLYGAVEPHQRTNCTGCHMAEAQNPDNTVRNDIGGHSWNMASHDNTVFNNRPCNTAECHNGRVPSSRTAFESWRDNTFDPTNDYDGDNTVEGIPEEINGLWESLRTLLLANNIRYDDLVYPYFLQAGTPEDNAFVAWTQPTLKAAFNLTFVIKALPSSQLSRTGDPNPSAAAHNHRYIIQLLRDSYDDLQRKGVSGQPVLGGVRPTGTRPATNYLNPGSTTYSPRQ